MDFLEIFTSGSYQRYENSENISLKLQVVQSLWIYLMDFLQIFTSGKYHRVMKILKILVSNSKRFKVYGIFKKLQIDDDKGGLPNTTIS